MNAFRLIYGGRAIYQDDMAMSAIYDITRLVLIMVARALVVSVKSWPFASAAAVTLFLAFELLFVACRHALAGSLTHFRDSETGTAFTPTANYSAPEEGSPFLSQTIKTAGSPRILDISRLILVSPSPFTYAWVHRRPCSIILFRLDLKQTISILLFLKPTN